MISIIVPVYNIEPYLPSCVESVLWQSFRDFELILVDDGSPDGCPALCDAYAEEDQRVRVIHQENGGLSEARNAGMSEARGEYMAFVDGDDIVHPAFLETLLSALSETGADIAECGVRKVYPGEHFPEEAAEAVAEGKHAEPENGDEAVLDTGSIAREESDGAVQDTGSGAETAPDAGGGDFTCSGEALPIYGTESALRGLIGDKLFHQTVWNKLYKRSCVEGLRFPAGKTNEDEFWTYQAFARAESVCRIDTPLYGYVQRESSIMGSGFSLKRLDALDAKAERLAFMRARFPALEKDAKLSLYGSCIYLGQMSLKYLKGEERDRAKAKIDRIRRTCVPSGEELAAVPFRQKIWLWLSKCSFFGLCRLKNLLGKGF